MDAIPCFELIDRARAGDGTAWAELDARVRGPLRRYALQLAGSRWPHLSSQDLVQEALLRASKSLATFAGADTPENTEACFRAWLKTIVRHVIIKLVHRHGLPMAAGGLDPARGGEEPAGRDPTASTGLRAADRAGKLALALGKLDPTDRALVEGFHFERRGHAELAAAHHCTVEQVRTRLKRARRELRELLGESP